MIVVKRGRSWVVLDREGGVVSRHRTKAAAVDASGGTYRVYRRPYRERVIVEEEVVRRKRKRNPWTVESEE
jgi:hypothetical protein